MFDRDEFVKYLKKRGVKLVAIAKALGVAPSTLYRKMQGESDFTRSEVQTCCEFLGVKELNHIFFASKVS